MANAITLHRHKDRIRTFLHERFGIDHATLDFEYAGVARDHSDRLIVHQGH